MFSNSSPKRQQLNSFILLVLFFCCASDFACADTYTPVAVYLTWQRDPTTTMTVQWISETNKEDDNVYYQKIGENGWQIAVGRHEPLPNQDPYFLHRVELTNLTPGTGYVFRTGEWDSVPYQFRTMPCKADRPFRFVSGGDMFHGKIEPMIETHKQAAKSDPHFALVGGDLAYAGSSSASKPYKDEGTRWLNWLMAWNEHMVTPEGYLVPFLPALGNHDVNGRWDQPKKNAAYFYTLFPFPGKNGYNTLDFGDYLSITALDSGHTNKVAGEQTLWLDQALGEKGSFPHKFAFYHVPAFPSVRKFNKNNSVQIRENWVPLFDKHGLGAAFEHHDHAYKRTHPILNEHVAENGVVYMGDGSWGTKKPRSPKSPDKTWYLAASKKAQTFILITIEGKYRTFQGITAAGEIIDEFRQEG